jgi:hypothetical protein
MEDGRRLKERIDLRPIQTEWEDEAPMRYLSAAVCSVPASLRLRMLLVFRARLTTASRHALVRSGRARALPPAETRLRANYPRSSD